MQKDEFIAEVNRTIPGINLTDENIKYIYKDTSNIPAVSGKTIVSVGRLTADVTITFQGKTKTYQAEDGTTFPNEFINNYKAGYFS